MVFHGYLLTCTLVSEHVERSCHRQEDPLPGTSVISGDHRLGLDKLNKLLDVWSCIVRLVVKYIYREIETLCYSSHATPE